jgi:hypothetical protein
MSFSSSQALPQTASFDASMCRTGSVTQLYEDVCSGSNSQCQMKLQQHCETQIHTAKDFNNQIDLLQCFKSQCKVGDKECMNRCASSTQ